MHQSTSCTKALLPFLLCVFTLLSSIAQEKQQAPDDLKLWFSHPASEWNEALPVGNGRLGAMVFGGIASERLQLNEESVWTGKPADFVHPEARETLPKVRALLFAGKYAEARELAQEKMMGDKKIHSTYQTLGDLQLDFGPITKDISNYRRELDLETAVAKVSYHAGDVSFTREVFSSAPDQALVVRLTASKPGALTFRLNLSRPGNKAKLELIGNEIIMSEHVGDGTGVKMVARVKVLQEGGSLQAAGESIEIENADAVTLLLTAATDYRGSDHLQRAATQLASAAKKDYDALKKDHLADHQQYFKRVDLHLGITDAAYFPTDARLVAMQNGNIDPHLVELYYQFGRYLLISSSRPGGLPANLQGIWADGLTPPWSADYHININIQMNYWPAEVTNLSKCICPS